ncbi:YbhN family protein [Nakamurella sp.]|uniref:YbhN family protein n=1 Tax=Nakamurella sp. TaxID=1869182 RepID=UPI003784145A
MDAQPRFTGAGPVGAVPPGIAPLNRECAQSPAVARPGITRTQPDRPSPTRRAVARWWPRIRLLAGALVLIVLIWRLGAGPFLAGLAAVNVPTVLAALAIGAVTTVCSAWRWRVVAARLGVGLPLRTAVAAYYGSQFLNSTLPGGVLGDVQRAVRHGRASGEPGRGMRSVAWERAAGPVVHLALTALLLVLLPMPWGLPSWWSGLLIVAIAVLAGFALTVRRTRWAALAVAEVRSALLARAAWPQVLAASVVVALGHALTFVIAARSAGVTASPGQLFPVAMLVLAAMLLPLNVGGWGPREGVAAGLFAAAGWGAAPGVAAATAFGVLALVATLPGIVVLLARPLGRPVAGEVRPVG